MSRGRGSCPGLPSYVENEVETVENIYIRLLQFLVGTEVDGDWGPKSKEAADRLIERIERTLKDFDQVLRR